MDAETRESFRIINQYLGVPSKRDEKRRLKAEEKKSTRPLVQRVMEADEQYLPMIAAQIRQCSDARIRRNVQDLLIEKLISPQQQVRDRALAVLVALGRPAAAALLLKLRKSRSIRSAVRYAEALGEMALRLPPKDRMPVIFDLNIMARADRRIEVRLACAELIMRMRGSLEEPAHDPPSQ